LAAAASKPAPAVSKPTPVVASKPTPVIASKPVPAVASKAAPAAAASKTSPVASPKPTPSKGGGFWGVNLVSNNLFFDEVSEFLISRFRMFDITCFAGNAEGWRLEQGQGKEIARACIVVEFVL
jgi:hypothetical protein